MPASLSLFFIFAATHQRAYKRARAHTHRLNDKKCGVGMRGRVVTLSLITSEANKADTSFVPENNSLSNALYSLDLRPFSPFLQLAGPTIPTLYHPAPTSPPGDTLTQGAIRPPFTLTLSSSRGVRQKAATSAIHLHYR